MQRYQRKKERIHDCKRDFFLVRLSGSLYTIIDRCSRLCKLLHIRKQILRSLRSIALEMVDLLIAMRYPHRGSLTQVVPYYTFKMPAESRNSSDIFSAIRIPRTVFY